MQGGWAQDQSHDLSEYRGGHEAGGWHSAVGPSACLATVWLLTIEVLDALDVIWVQLEVLDVAVHGVHQGLTHAGVVQPQ